MFKLRHIIQELPREIAQAKQFRRRGDNEIANQISERIIEKIFILSFFAAVAGMVGVLDYELLKTFAG